MTSPDNGRAVAIMMLAMMGFIFNDSFVKLVSENLPLGQIMFLRGVFALAFLLVIMACLVGFVLTAILLPMLEMQSAIGG